MFSIHFNSCTALGAFVFLQLLTTNNTFGETRDKADTLSTKKVLSEVQVRGSRHAQLRAAMPTQILTNKEIASLNAHNIADVAKHFAGVTVKDFGGIGGLKTISVRGLGAAHTGVALDGLVMSDVQSGQIDLSQFCIENIETVSLDNGQPSSILQSARMFASSSVLSLYTKLAPNEIYNTLEGQAGLKVGSFGLINPHFLFQHKFSSRLAMSLSANGTKADGEYPFSLNINPYGKNYVEAVRSNTDVTNLRSELNATYQFTPKEFLKFKTSHYYSDRGIPGAVILYNYKNAKGRLNDKNLLSQFYYENKNSQRWQYLLAGKYNRQDMRYTDTNNIYSDLVERKLVETYLQNEYYASGALQFRPIANLTIAGAVDAWYNNLFSASNLSYKEDSKPNRKTLLANLSAKYVNERFTFGGNILYTGTKEQTNSTLEAPDRHKLSPTVYASWQLFENSNLILRTFYKEIFRLPTFTELYYHDFGYKYLKPETSHQYNIGLTYESRNIPFLSKFSCTADAYYNQISDKITIVYGMPFSTVRNIGSVNIQGVDVNLSFAKEIHKFHCIQLLANYTYQLAQDGDRSSETYGDIIPYTPIHSGSTSLNYSYKKLDFGYNFLFAGKRYNGQNADRLNYLAPYVDQSVFGRYNFRKLRLMAEIINVANVTYSIVQYYPMPGRNYRFSINYKF